MFYYLDEEQSFRAEISMQEGFSWIASQTEHTPCRMKIVG
jgi:hypothetical protein